MITVICYNSFFVLCFLGAFFLDREKTSRGKGTWYSDRELLMLAGASWALALVCFAAMIVSALA